MKRSALFRNACSSAFKRSFRSEALALQLRRSPLDQECETEGIRLEGAEEYWKPNPLTPRRPETQKMPPLAAGGHHAHIDHHDTQRPNASHAKPCGDVW